MKCEFKQGLFMGVTLNAHEALVSSKHRVPWLLALCAEIGHLQPWQACQGHFPCQ